MGMMLGPASALGLQPPVELGQAGEPEPRLEEAASDCLDLLLDLALLPSRRRREGGRLDHVMIGHDQEAAVNHTLLAVEHGRQRSLRIIVDNASRHTAEERYRTGLGTDKQLNHIARIDRTTGESSKKS